MEQTAVFEWKWLGDDKLCNSRRCKSISWRPTLGDNRDVLEHCYAAKQHLLHSIRGMQKGDLERGMLYQGPTMDITHSNRLSVRAQVIKVKSHFIHSPQDNILELCDLHRFESAAEHLEFMDSPLADDMDLLCLAEQMEGGLCIPNPIQIVKNC